ncbi:unnamed protein product, partial [Hydatigera taeniaeformis]|uniref:F-box domain-containing protein n=1 Tax=Hydatigena taeniaeformis TaxID=6205 RepID=A0A0R3WP04_HYDTA
MVAGLLDLVRVDAAYVFEVPSSRCIVFNPVELLFNILRRSAQFDNVGAYGVDLLHARVLFEDFMREMLCYDVKLIPVVDGISNTGVLALRSVASNCRKASKRYKEADLDVGAERYCVGGEFFPCQRQFVTDCFQELGWRCVQTSYNSMSVCLGIAYFLDCPVASMSSRYLLVSRPEILPGEVQSLTVNELKLVDLRSDFYCADEEEGESVFKLKVFHPELTVLKKVPATSRPLIALLMDSILIPILPAAINVCPSESESYTAARLRAVINWVAETNPIRVLQTIMESAKDVKCMDYISENILRILGNFCPDFVEASRLLKMLDVGEGVPSLMASKKGVREVREQQRQRPSSPMYFFQTAAGLLKGAAELDRPVDFQFRWPVALVHLYRFNRLDKIFLTALYNKYGVLLRYQNDYLVEFPSAFGPSRILRYGHYCLIKGVEEANGLISKLTGLRPYAKEMCYEGHFRYKIYLLEVRSMQL